MIALDLDMSSKRLACWIEEAEDDVHILRPTKKRRQQPKRSGVTFEEASNEVHYRAYDETDLQNSWISQDEYQLIREDTKQTILEIKKVRGKMSLMDANHFCVRGLERLISSLISKSNKGAQKEIVRKVLSEFQAQKKGGYCDEAAVSAVYASLTMAAMKKARHLADVDARAR